MAQCPISKRLQESVCFYDRVAKRTLPLERTKFWRNVLPSFEEVRSRTNQCPAQCSRQLKGLPPPKDWLQNMRPPSRNDPHDHHDNRNRSRRSRFASLDCAVATSALIAVVAVGVAAAVRGAIPWRARISWAIRTMPLSASA